MIQVTVESIACETAWNFPAKSVPKNNSYSQNIYLLVMNYRGVTIPKVISRNTRGIPPVNIANQAPNKTQDSRKETGVTPWELMMEWHHPLLYWLRSLWFLVVSCQHPSTDGVLKIDLVDTKAKTQLIRTISYKKNCSLLNIEIYSNQSK